MLQRGSDRGHVHLCQKICNELSQIHDGKLDGGSTGCGERCERSGRGLICAGNRAMVAGRGGAEIFREMGWPLPVMSVVEAAVERANARLPP